MSPEDPSSNLRAICGSLPSGPVRGRARDWLAFQYGKTGGRLAHLLHGTKKERPHPQVLRAAVAQILKAFPEPQCIETGCIRRADEGTASTLAIAQALAGRGKFTTLELEPEHIETCRQVCQDHLDQINFIQGDARAELLHLVQQGTFQVVHLAFFDSADDPSQTLAEFRAIEQLFVSGSLVVVDDVIRGVKGLLLKPLLAQDPNWYTRLIYAGNGMLLARKR